MGHSLLEWLDRAGHLAAARRSQNHARAGRLGTSARRQLTGDEGVEHQLNVPSSGVAADHVGCHVRHLKIACVHVVHEQGAVERVPRILSERPELLGDVGDPAFGDPAHRAQRRRMIGVCQQGDLGAVGGPPLEGGREELIQACGRVGFSLQFLYHRVGAPVLPPVERRLDQGVPVLEVLVDAALGGAELGGNGLHRDSADAPARDRGKRRPGPVIGREWTANRLAHDRTVPYGLHHRVALFRPVGQMMMSDPAAGLLSPLGRRCWTAPGRLPSGLYGASPCCAVTAREFRRWRNDPVEFRGHR